MIDTIVLSLPKEKFKILDYNAFSPSASGLFDFPYMSMGSKGFVKCVQNPPKNEMKVRGIYKPRLTLIKAVRKGGSCIELKIEFSIPKLIFGNNFEELSDANFNRVVELLQKALLEMQVATNIEDLKIASVSAIHFSKNMALREYVTCSMVINELRNLDLGKRIDIGEEKFRNGGRSIHFQTKTRDIVFYDKVKDLEQASISASKAIEKDSAIQLNLLDGFAQAQGLEVLRMEIRLGNRKEIEQVLAKIKYRVDMNFSSLFSKEIAFGVLNHYWAMFYESSHVLRFKSEGVFDLAETIRLSCPKMSSKKLLEVVGAMVLSNEGGSVRLRSFLKYEGNLNKNRQWYKLRKYVRCLQYRKTNKQLAMDQVGDFLQIANCSM